MYKADKVFVGVLCKRKHEYQNSGGSLRYLKTKGCCVECKQLQRKEWAEKYPERDKKIKKDWQEDNRPHHAEWKRQYRKAHPLETLCNHARNSTKHKNKGCDINEEFLKQLWEKQDGKCYWFGCKIDLMQSTRHPLKATLDRLDNDKGYTKDNVVWASGLANMGRRDTPASEFRQVLNVVRDAVIEEYHAKENYIM
jgi:hypothetical protein